MATGVLDGALLDLLIDNGANLSDHGVTLLKHAVRVWSTVDGRHVLFHLLRRDRHNRFRHRRLAALVEVDAPLLRAIWDLNIEPILALLAAGAKLHTLPEQGMCVFESLKAHGYASHFPLKYRYPWIGDAPRVQSVVLKLLLHISYRFEEIGVFLRCSPLHWAASIGSFALVKELVEENRADVYDKNAAGVMPLLMVLTGVPEGLHLTDEQLECLRTEKSKICLYLIDRMLDAKPRRLLYVSLIEQLQKQVGLEGFGRNVLG